MMGCRSASSVGPVLTRRVSTEGPSALCPWPSRSISAPSRARSPRPRSRPRGSSAVRHRSAARCRSSPVSLAAAPQYASPWRSTARTLRTSSRRSSRTCPACWWGPSSRSWDRRLAEYRFAFRETISTCTGVAAPVAAAAMHAVGSCDGVRWYPRRRSASHTRSPARSRRR